MLSLRSLAIALSGDIVGRDVLAPGPGHSKQDRSLAIRLSSGSPDGFVTHSFAGDDWRECNEHVRDRLGIAREPSRSAQKPARAKPRGAKPDRPWRRGYALMIWNAACDPRDTLVETYLKSRALELPKEIAGRVLRFHPRCPWRDKPTNTVIRVPAMIALFRDIATDEPVAIHRTRLDAEGRKIDRAMLGPSKGAAIKIDVDDAVTGGLHLAEGIESALAARQSDFRPVWALGSAGAIASFPVFDGVECLTLFRENDANGTSQRDCAECADRWLEAGREILFADSLFGKDANDALRAAI